MGCGNGGSAGNTSLTDRGSLACSLKAQPLAWLTDLRAEAFMLDQGAAYGGGRGSSQAVIKLEACLQNLSFCFFCFTEDSARCLHTASSLLLHPAWSLPRELQPERCQAPLASAASRAGRSPKIPRDPSDGGTAVSLGMPFC